jgi:hypothetical protein
MARMFVLECLLAARPCLSSHGVSVGLGGGVPQLVVEVLACDVVLGVGALDLVLDDLLGALLVALDLLGEPVLLFEFLALLAGLLGDRLGDLRRCRACRGVWV